MITGGKEQDKEVRQKLEDSVEKEHCGDDDAGHHNRKASVLEFAGRESRILH